MNALRSVAFHTLGCKLNFSETSAIAKLFGNQSYRKVGFDERADVFVINTCSVTENANRECRAIVRKALRNSPSAFVAVIGCYAQLKPEEIVSIPGVDLVLGASEKFDILSYLSPGKNFPAKVFAQEISHCNSFHSSFSSGERTRSFLKVQDGCDYVCSFCTIPMARGKSRSDTIGNTILSAKNVLATGVKEIVLTGVNIGDFGKSPSSEKESFLDLLKEFDVLPGLERLRISSIEPNLLTDEIIEFAGRSKTIAPHFHIPLQSGSDRILRSMRRRYNTEDYKNRIEKIKSLNPHCCIGADVIVGFPGETEEEFQKTYAFLNTLELSYLHVFTYSERDNTAALEISQVVPVEERNRRNRMLRILSEKKRNFFYEQNTGKTLSVLFENKNEDGMMRGYSENYIRVRAPFQEECINRIVPVTLNESPDGGEMGCTLPAEFGINETVV